MGVTMERLLVIIVGAIFLGGGSVLAKHGWEDDKNTIECVAFGLMGVVFGVFLFWVGIFGPPE